MWASRAAAWWARATATRRSRERAGCGAGPSASPRAGSPGPTRGSGRRLTGSPRSFWGRHAVRSVAHGGHHGKGEHDQRDVPVPAVPGAGLVVSKPKLGLGGLERVLDGPAPPFNGHEPAGRRAGRAPGREEGELAVGQAAADQKAAHPQPSPGGAIVAGSEIGQLAVSPVVEPLALGALAGRQSLPGTLRQTAGECLAAT